MENAITMLGCGASAGVPLIGCDCAVCRSTDSRNKKTRASILVTYKGKTVLVDASPDLRQQALREGFKQIDALVITHAHADHCHGVDDLRSFNFHRNASIPLYADGVTLRELRERFGYIFKDPPEKGWFRPAVTAHEVEVTDQPATITIADTVPITFFNQQHGQMHSLGLRIGNTAYSTDVDHFPESAYPMLYDLDLWIIDCLRYEPAPTHAHFDKTMAWIEQFKPKKAILTHLSHDFDYESLNNQTPEHVIPAFDGLKLPIS